MSAIAWEYELVEKPFCQQLASMGWEWIKGDPDLPETTERTTSREVLLRARLAGALRKINLHDGRSWLDDVRIDKAVQ
jgi:type I restriction enzyme R subunit